MQHPSSATAHNFTFPAHAQIWDATIVLGCTNSSDMHQHTYQNGSCLWRDTWFAARVVKIYLVGLAAKFFLFLGMESGRAQRCREGSFKLSVLTWCTCGIYTHFNQPPKCTMSDITVL